MSEILRNGRVFKDGRFTTVDLEIADGRVKASGQLSGVGSREIDLQGGFVLPGLIDVHAHLVLSTDARRDEPLSTRILKGARNAAIQLEAGVTSVRDVGGPGRIALELAESIEAGVVDGPRVWSSGSFVCSTGGHVHYWGREADGVDDVRRAVREQRKQGASFLKLMASGGVAEPGERPDACQFTAAEIGAACEEAARSGTYVAAHAHPADAIQLCLEAGVRTIEHASFMSNSNIELAVASGAFIVPTFVVYAELVDSVHLSQRQRDLAAGVLERKSESFLKAVEAGVRWGVGTDAGSFMPQGRLWQEMRYLQDLGIPGSSVLEAATATNAAILDVPTIGNLEPGSWADLIVVDADPTHDVSVLSEPSLVMKAGRVVRGTHFPAATQRSNARIGG
jgi:imidazolonepropionase-like amidohydrolase